MEEVATITTIICKYNDIKYKIPYEAKGKSVKDLLQDISSRLKTQHIWLKPNGYNLHDSTGCCLFEDDLVIDLVKDGDELEIKPKNIISGLSNLIASKIESLTTTTVQNVKKSSPPISPSSSTSLEENKEDVAVDKQSDTHDDKKEEKDEYADVASKSYLEDPKFNLKDYLQYQESLYSDDDAPKLSENYGDETSDADYDPEENKEDEDVEEEDDEEKEDDEDYEHIAQKLPELHFKEYLKFRAQLDEEATYQVED